MRRVLLLVAFLAALASLLPVPAESGGDVYVRGYVRRDGSYVAPHYRSAPDGNPYNNWSTYPNVNPYTGQQGTRTVPNPLLTPSAPSYTPRSTCVLVGYQKVCY